MFGVETRLGFRTLRQREGNSCRVGGRNLSRGEPTEEEEEEDREAE